jgi:hypothetical protein
MPRLAYVGLTGVLAAIAGLLVLPMSASASPTKTVTFLQYLAEEFPGIPQSLRGINAVVTCPDGSVTGGAFGPLFSFDATREGGTSTGSWHMLAAPGAASGDTGDVTDAKISNSHFKLKATWDDINGSGHDIICGEPIPATAEIKGPCGTGVIVEFRGSNGVTGTFQGDVTCEN